MRLTLARVQAARGDLVAQLDGEDGVVEVVRLDHEGRRIAALSLDGAELDDLAELVQLAGLALEPRGDDE